MKQPIIALDARCIGRRNTGDTTYWTGLIYGLSQIQSDLRYLLLSNDLRPPEIPNDERLRWIQLPSRSSRWWSMVTFPLQARKLGASAIHTQYNLSPLAKNGATTIHDVSFFVGPEWFKPRDRVVLQRFVPSSARRASRIITVSETSKADIAKFIPGVGSKTRVTPLALSTVITPVEAGKARAMVERDFNVGGPYVLTVGTRWPRKNMMLAVDAMERLTPKLPHRLLVTGQPGWGEDERKSRSRSLGYVSDEQLSALYSAADLYLAPSRYEGFGLTLLEAFACGSPVLCSTGGALPEVAGDAAQIEPSWEPDEWARAIEDLLTDSSKLAAMSERGLRRAAAFSWKETARLTEQVYREVLT